MPVLATLAPAALLITAPRALAAPAEPELLPLSPSTEIFVPTRKTPPRPEPAPRPPERDELREKIRLGPPRRAYVTVRSRAWLAQGGVTTRYAVQIPREQVIPPGDVFLGETEERESEGTLMIQSVEIAPLTWFSGEFEYGEDRASGRYTDRFWIHSPDFDTLTNLDNGAVWHNPDHEDDAVFQADHAARRSWAAANAFFRLLEGRVTASDEFEVRNALDAAKTELSGLYFGAALRF